MQCEASTHTLSRVVTPSTSLGRRLNATHFEQTLASSTWPQELLPVGVGHPSPEQLASHDPLHNLTLQSAVGSNSPVAVKEGVIIARMSAIGAEAEMPCFDMMPTIS